MQELITSRWPLYAVLLLAGLMAGCSPKGAEETTGPGTLAAGERPPNVIVIFTDDQGYQDVGVYGAEGYETPHLDELAREGMRFTDFHVAASACSPSRAALLTGSYPLRVGLPTVLGPQSRVGLNPDEVTVAELLKEQGYATAAIGKWHLGDHPKFLPTNHGFDSYFGLPYSNDMSPVTAHNPRERAKRHPPLPLIQDTSIVEREPDQSTLTRRYTEKALGFIERNQEEPFFLYMPHTFPHVPLYASEQFEGTTEQGTYGDVIREIDWSVGQIMGKLEELRLEGNTLIAFTSDNGPWLVYGDHAGKTGPYREGKGTSFEGGQRVPFIVRWPGKIPAGTVADEFVTAMDLLPTIAHVTGAEVPSDRVIDGHNIWPILSRQSGAESPYERFFYYRGGQLQAVRSGRWKLHIPHDYRTLEGGEVGHDGELGEYGQGHIGLALFDLEEDPGETANVAGEHPAVVERLKGYIEAARRDIGDRAIDAEGERARPVGRVEEPWDKQVEAAPNQ